MNFPSVRSEKASEVASVERLALELVQSTPVAVCGRNFLFLLVRMSMETYPWNLRSKGKS